MCLYGLICDSNMEPVTKKTKLSTIAESLRSMRSSTKNLTPILNDKLLKDCSLHKFYYVKVKEKKWIQTTIIKFNSSIPLDKYQHLKRAKGVSILLSPADSIIPPEKLLENLKEDNFDLDILEDEIEEIFVPSEAPLIRRQYDIANRIWPCNFHPNKHLERLVSDSCFDVNELDKHRKYMEVAYEIGLLNARTENLEDIRGVVVVDPLIDSIVAVGDDSRSKNPCKHAVMVAIDNVAKSQNGGAWKSDEDHRGVPREYADLISNKFGNTVKIGARPTLHKDQCLESGSDPSGPYLCTNYHVYTTKEPCFMCAMGLIHSRVKIVFFGNSNSNYGSLGSTCKLHTAIGLNHHYDVYTGFFDT